MAKKTTEEKEKTEEKKVKIKLFKDTGKYKDDVTVGLNGKFYRIRRGVEVEVPAGVAEILDNAAAQRESCAAYIDELKEDFERESEKYGIET